METNAEKDINKNRKDEPSLGLEWLHNEVIVVDRPQSQPSS